MDINGTNPPDPKKENFQQNKKFIKNMLENWEEMTFLLNFEAKKLRTLYLALMEQGFTKEQALEIVKTQKKL